MNRGITIDIRADDESRPAVLNSIRRYRAGCRQMFAVLGCAMGAGAEIVSNRPGLAQRNTG